MSKILKNSFIGALLIAAIIAPTQSFAQSAVAPTPPDNRALQPINKDEIMSLFRRAPDQDNIDAKTKRRRCISGGGTWVTNSHGSFCLPGREVTAVQVRALGFSVSEVVEPRAMNNSRLGLSEAPDGAPSWVWLERRRCVRSGGVFHENSGGTFCWKLLDPA